ncbi:MAG: cell division ATP-binding protein FtsE [Gammaproteobacteria bacterium]|nr:cell division ATP-binding protein FtsE [Gammaproteobacteria bacterium]
MLQFDHVFKRYPSGQDALSDVNFFLAAGEMAFLTGHSGAGKSTFLKLVTAIEYCSRGQIIINGMNISKLPKWRVPYLRRQIGVIFQDHQLLHDRTVFDNVALPLIIAGYAHREIGRRVRASLDKVDLLHKERAYPITLSGGEQQRVGIARAVVNKPPILLADEPTGNLDPALSRDIMNLFASFHQVGVTVLVATHAIDLINTLPYRRIILSQGKLIHDGHAALHEEDAHG